SARASHLLWRQLTGQLPLSRSRGLIQSLLCWSKRARPCCSNPTGIEPALFGEPLMNVLRECCGFEPLLTEPEQVLAAAISAPAIKTGTEPRQVCREHHYAAAQQKSGRHNPPAEEVVSRRRLAP